jgi:hypothetical protein
MSSTVGGSVATEFVRVIHVPRALILLVACDFCDGAILIGASSENCESNEI